MQWFEKDHVSDVRFFIFSNHLTWVTSLTYHKYWHCLNSSWQWKRILLNSREQTWCNTTQDFVFCFWPHFNVNVERFGCDNLKHPWHLSHGGFILSRVAMVTIKGPLAAEFAVGKMNGVCVPGSTLHVGHIRPVTESLSPALQIPVASSKVPEETGGATKPSANKTHSSLTVGKVRGS